jgi:peptidoglycan/xylan/chitin deacetylase (PgdA/CDA1 family)
MGSARNGRALGSDAGRPTQEERVGTRRSRALSIGIPLAAAGAYWGFRFASSSFVRPYMGDTLLWKVETARPLVALTFDDGPDPAYTSRFLEALGPHRATFFMLGHKVERWPELARAVEAAGHEVACHGYSHRTMTRMAPWTTVRELVDSRSAIETAIGRGPGYFRPAFGRFNLASWVLAPRLGMRRTLWSAGARDWEQETTPELIVERIVGGSGPGAVLLLHDSDGDPGAPEHTLAAIPGILEGLSQRGLELVTLTELVEATGTTAGLAGLPIRAAQGPLGQSA